VPSGRVIQAGGREAVQLRRLPPRLRAAAASFPQLAVGGAHRRRGVRAHHRARPRGRIAAGERRGRRRSKPIASELRAIRRHLPDLRSVWEWLSEKREQADDKCERKSLV